MVSEGNSGTACDVASNVFNSELGSNYLAHYGLDGPLAEYQPPPSEYGNDAPEEPSEVIIRAIRKLLKRDKNNLKYLDVSPVYKVPLPSGTSIGTKKRRATEKKNATIRQHYYPEVVFCTQWSVIAHN